MVAVDRWADSVAAWRTVRVDPDRCMVLISQKAPCSECVRICPVSAINPGDLVNEACDTCGLCAAACPADAILLDSPSDQGLLQQLTHLSHRSDQVLFSCHPPADLASMQVGCLGRLSPELLMAAAACGFSQIDLVADECECSACPKAAGLSRAKSALLVAQSALNHLGQTCEIRLINAAKKPAPRRTAGGKVERPVYAERRAFLLSALGLLREILPWGIPPEAPAQPTNSRRRELLLWALAQFKRDHLPVAWGERGLHLTNPCHHCGICQRLCPNGAIQISQEQLQLDPVRCHSCGLCTHLCPAGSLQLGPPRTLVASADGIAWQPLGEPADLACARCSSQFCVTSPTPGPTGEALCLTCQIRGSSKTEVFLHD